MSFCFGHENLTNDEINYVHFFGKISCHNHFELTHSYLNAEKETNHKLKNSFIIVCSDYLTESRWCLFLSKIKVVENLS